MAALDLKEGDDVLVTVAGERDFRVGRDTSREDAVARLRAMRVKLPAGFRFDRDEANERQRIL